MGEWVTYTVTYGIYLRRCSRRRARWRSDCRNQSRSNLPAHNTRHEHQKEKAQPKIRNARQIPQQEINCIRRDVYCVLYRIYRLLRSTLYGRFDTVRSSTLFAEVSHHPGCVGKQKNEYAQSKNTTVRALDAQWKRSTVGCDHCILLEQPTDSINHSIIQNLCILLKQPIIRPISIES